MILAIKRFLFLPLYPKEKQLGQSCPVNVKQRRGAQLQWLSSLGVLGNGFYAALGFTL